MLADTSNDNIIFYMNKAAKTIFAKYHDELKSVLPPGSDASNALQRSIHQFHKTPDAIRKVLADLSAGKMESHVALIPMGRLTFSTTIYPIWDPQNKSQTSCFTILPPN